MPTVRIDDEVYAELQARARPFVDTPNDVLRRVFDLHQAKGKRAAPVIGERSSDMRRLLDAGLIAEGDVFVWNRPRKGERHELTVRAGGAMSIPDGRVFGSPSPALGELSGNSVNAWRVLVRERDGVTLAELRDRL